MDTISRTRLILLFLSGAIVLYGMLGLYFVPVAAEDDPYGPLALFTDVLQKIRRDYVEDPDLNVTVNGGLQGMVEALDPYSSFVDATVFADLREQREMPASPGLFLSKRYGYGYVVSVAPGSPAEKAGLSTGDLLESIEDRVTSGMSLWEIETRLRGAEGSEVTVRVVRRRRTEPTVVVLPRVLPVPSRVDSRVLEGEIGLLEIRDFEKGVAEQLETRLRMLLASNVRGLLIDVRGNASGLLEEARVSSDLFLEQGTRIVTVRNRGVEETVHTALQPALVSGLPLVVLIDGGTSGVAEAFTAALRDHDLAELVGLRSNGRGSLQESFPLSDGSLLSITTQLVVRASGDPIQNKSLRLAGIEPDVRSPEPEFITNYYFENTGDDMESSLTDEFYRQLDEAIQAEQLKAGLKRVQEKSVRKAA